jgi:hypothetical protein
LNLCTTYSNFFDGLKKAKRLKTLNVLGER